MYSGGHVITADSLALVHQQQFAQMLPHAAPQAACSQQANGGGAGGGSPEHSGASSSTRPPSTSEAQSLASQMLTIRMLMSGKKGENVKKYREESGARINISDGSCPERIVTVTGTVDQIHVAFAMMCQKFEDDFTQSMQRAVANASSGINALPAPPGPSASGTESPTPLSNPSMTDDVSCPPVTLRLLVPATQCGSIIGKGGCKIKEIRELTGASIQVASEVLPNSSERTVTISGTAKAIAKCIKQLCHILLESPAKGATIPYRPKPMMLAAQQPQLQPPGPPHPHLNPNPHQQQQQHHPLGNGFHPGQLLAQAGAAAGAPMTFAPDLNKSATPVNVSLGLPYPAAIPGDAILAGGCLSTAQLALAAAAGLQAPPPPPPPPIPAALVPSSQPHQQHPHHQYQPPQSPQHLHRPAPPAPTNTHELVISNDLIGCIIGRGGSKINEIRQLSGAQIKINNCDEGAKERRVTVTGTPETIATAQYLISSSIELHRQLLALNMAVCAGFGVNPATIGMPPPLAPPPPPVTSAAAASGFMFRSVQQPTAPAQQPQSFIDLPLPSSKQLSIISQRTTT
uniref:KH domain-containing protein n=1 Tax=Macrostomum lignano TaxID=282301 RepID=A0A1I8H1P1_9PLAT